MAQDILLPDKVQYFHINDSDIFYMVVRKEDRKVRDVVSDPGNWVLHPSNGSLANFAIGEGSCIGGLWSGGFPPVVTRHYIVQIRLREGSIPDCSDRVVGVNKGYWNGNIFTVPLMGRCSEFVVIDPYDYETGRRT